MDSILTSIKGLLGVDEEYTHFDPDITIAINSSLMAATQLGVGPSTGFMVTSKDQTWAQFLGDRKDLEAVKSYVYLKVRLLFDPPTNSFLIDSMKNQIQEYEWRLNVQAEPIPVPITEGGMISE